MNNTVAKQPVGGKAAANVWLVMTESRNGTSWISMHGTKAEAITAADDWLSDTPADERPDAIWVVKSPYFIVCE